MPEESKFLKPENITESEYLEKVNEIISEMDNKKYQKLVKRKEEITKAKNDLLDIINDD